MVLRIALKMKLKVETLSRGGGYLLLRFPYNQFYADSYRYIRGKLSSFPKRFSLAPFMSKGYFPFKALKPENFRYHGPFFPLSYYTSFHDTAQQIEEKMAFLKANQGNQFIMRQQLQRYAQMDSELLLYGALIFTLQSFEMEEQLKKLFDPHVPKGRLPYLTPFMQPFCTLGSYA